MSISIPLAPRGFVSLALALALGAGFSFPTRAAQDGQPAEAQAKADEKKQAEDELREAVQRLIQARSKKPADWTGEDLAEIAASAYRGVSFNQYKKVFNTGREEGRITIATTDGELEGEYMRRYAFGPTMSQDRVRLDIIFGTSQRTESQLRYTLTYNGATVWAAQNNRFTTPEPAAATAFKASILNDYTAIFRYRDEGATLTRGGKKKVQGLELEVLDMARQDGSKLRFYVSPKTYRVLHVEYDVVLAEGQAPVAFRESYTDWKLIQEVWHPAKRKLRQNDQVVQTIELANGTYGMTHEDSVFLQL